jgi:hypothetical protein
MTSPTALRLIGTGYEGKEPLEHTADVLRAATGARLGFEACLTSRPFTARTYVAGRPGAVLAGRPVPEEASRADIDLVDGLDALTAAGFVVDVVDAEARPRPGSVLLVGPLPTPGRWVPPAELLVAGALVRHVVVDQVQDGTATCLDPAFGGYTAVELYRLAGLRWWRVQAPAAPVDTLALARHCLRAGMRWRVGAAGPDHDEAGLALLADGIRGGTTALRLRVSLAAHALHALRWSALLGHCGPLTTGELALADLLGEVVEHCRVAQHALTTHDPDTAAATVRDLARTATAITELCHRDA